jgi:hypothetical protein
MILVILLVVLVVDTARGVLCTANYVVQHLPDVDESAVFQIFLEQLLTAAQFLSTSDTSGPALERFKVVTFLVGGPFLTEPFKQV